MNERCTRWAAQHARAGGEGGGGENYNIGLQLLPVTAMVDDIGVVAEVRDVQLFLFERDARAGALSAVRTIAATTTASSGGRPAPSEFAVAAAAAAAAARQQQTGVIFSKLSQWVTEFRCLNFGVPLLGKA